MANATFDSPPNDPLGAFCRENHAALKGTGSGPLAGLTFAAKDVFDIAGSRTGFGSPTWLHTRILLRRPRRQPCSGCWTPGPTWWARC